MIETSSSPYDSTHVDIISRFHSALQSTTKSVENDHTSISSSVINDIRSLINTSDTKTSFSSFVSTNEILQSLSAIDSTSTLGIDPLISSSPSSYSSFDSLSTSLSNTSSSDVLNTNHPSVHYDTNIPANINTTISSSDTTIFSKTSINLEAFNNSTDISTIYKFTTPNTNDNKFSSHEIITNLISTESVNTPSILFNATATNSELTGSSEILILSSTSTTISSTSTTISSTPTTMHSTPTTISPTQSGQNDQKAIAGALGTLGAILVLTIIGILAVLWFRSRKRKIRMTLMKLRTISQQTQNSEEPPDICLDINSFNFAQLYYDKYDEPDVTSHTPRRMLSAHEDALNFSKEDLNRSISQIESCVISNKSFSHVPSNRTSSSSKFENDSTMPPPTNKRVSFSDV